jgi:hypothetical protein
LDISQLTQFLGHRHIFKTPYRCIVKFDDGSPDTSFTLDEDAEHPDKGTTLTFPLLSDSEEWQLPRMTALLNPSSSPFPLSFLETLYISCGETYNATWDEDTDIQWLEMLRPFTAVKDLHIESQIALHLSCALQELAGERASEVLPALQNIFIVEYDLPAYAAQEAMKPFVAARQLSGHPVAVHRC